MTTQNTSTSLALIALLLAIGIIGYYIMNKPDDRNTGEKIGDAISELKDRTPAERLQDNLDTNN